jgi:L-malate glycosyltransferase
VVVHGETGYLAPVGDVEALAGYALAVLSDEERIRTMGEAARRRAAGSFDSEQLIPRYEAFYEKIMQES